MASPEALAQKYNVSLEIAEAALSKIKSGEVLFLTISGKIGAGKDTVAPLVVEKLGYPNAVHESFAGALRVEVNQVIEIIRGAADYDEAVATVQKELNPVNFLPVMDALYDVVKNRVINSAYDRTDETRKALQWWGTEVRRSVDPDYWVKRAMASSLTKLAEGTSIYVTDSRFPNEATCIEEAGGLLVRLLVSQEEQARRIMARDGLKPTAEALNHASETAMDDYYFANVVDTDKLDLEGVVDSVVAMHAIYV